ncbi:pyridoxamine 5'-phosphate oxidase family protein [Longispora sp. K20-0274]|uniref:pyridoxamine 5'-phosphate oxidase family protein n=1 Tax=Longispora sp. K20-0274 TaxID=3088255 RepID=UPI00399B5164
MSDMSPGDFGRRLRWRRDELGLSRAEVAERAGIGQAYLDFVEHHPDTPTPQTVVRLARALDTTAEQLLGAQVLLPPGRGLPAPGAHLITLSFAECVELVAPGGIGRVGFSTQDGPMILPVNFGLAPEGIVFRTTTTSPLAAVSGQVVAFEVDGVDEALSEGWSVVVVGPARVVTGAVETLLLAGWTGVRSWAGGTRDTYLNVPMDRVSGRMIRTS